MLQFIVLLAIMAIWAVTSLLSREAQPLPPRPIRRPGPEGLRPSPITRTAPGNLPGQIGTAARASGGMAVRTPSGRWVEPQAAGSVRPAPGRGIPSDEIVVIEPDPRGSRTLSNTSSLSAASAAARTQRGGQPRRSSRGRTAAGTGPVRPAEKEPARALSDQISQSMALKRNRPLEISPLDAPANPFGTPLSHLATSTLREPPKSGDTAPAFDKSALRSMLASRNKLREVALLSEILQPPLALRPRSRPRSS
jgi:hypothetical protein